MLIDRYLPSFDVREYHEEKVRGDPSHVYEAFKSLDLNRSRVVRLLFALRTLPSRWSRSEAPPLQTPPRTFLESALAVGWVVLEELPGQELVVGAVTQPWAPVVHFRGLPASQFLTFSEPGFTKIVWSIGVRNAGSGVTVAHTETRVSATDSESRRRFRRYWFVFSPGIRLIRRVALRLLKAQESRFSPAA